MQRAYGDQISIADTFDDVDYEPEEDDMPDFWDVSIWSTLDESRQPVKSKRFKTEASAQAYADRQREIVERLGWTHTVRVTPGMIHK